MSLQSSMAVMKAKLAGNTPQLIALAQQGDFEAAAALKEMMDKKAYAQGVANETAMGQPDTLPVLEQIAGNLDTPQSGLAAYAHGGMRRSFQSGGSTGRWGDETQEDRDRAMFRRWWESIKGGSRNAAAAAADVATTPVRGLAGAFDTGVVRPLRAAGFDAGFISPKLQPEGTTPGSLTPFYDKYGNRDEPTPTTPASPASASPNPTARLKRQEGAGGDTGYTGIAAARAPTARQSSGPPQKSQPVPPAKILAGPPAAEELDDKELLAATEKLTTLQKERDALRDKSRAQLEDAYNAKVKALTPSKFDKIMTFLAGVQAHGGASAAQALGAGAQKMYGLQKAAQAQIAAAKEAYARADLLEQQALKADQINDVKGAMALRKEALELRRQAKKDEADTKLKGSQAGYYDAQTRYTDTIKPIVEQQKAQAAVTRADRSGIAAGAGKPMTAAQRASETRRLFDMFKEDLNNDQVPDSVLWARAAAQVETNAGKPAAASPAGPKNYDFGALMQGQ